MESPTSLKTKECEAYELNYILDALRHPERPINPDPAICSRSRTIVANILKRIQYDELSKLLNQRTFTARLKENLARNRYPRLCAISLVDIQRFKALNDTFGHAAGNKVIEVISELWAKHMRRHESDSSLHGRLGKAADEFLVFNPGLPSRSAPRQIALRAKLAVSRFDWSTVIPDLPRPIGVDVGIAVFHFSGAIPYIKIDGFIKEALRIADHHMYKAKRRFQETGKDVPAVHCYTVTRNGHIVSAKHQKCFLPPRDLHNESQKEQRNKSRPAESATTPELQAA